MTLIYDITYGLAKDFPVWPGDTPFAFAFAWSMAAGAAVNVGSLTMSTHTGTHVDAPLHYVDGAAGMADIPLDRFWGPCQVISCAAPLLTAKVLRGLPLVGRPRLLIRTGCSLAEGFPERYSHPTPDGIAYLAGVGVKLIGLDAPSVDALESKVLPTHRACYDHDVLILESAKLEAVPDGLYTLVALPLKLLGGDASPVRAVLVAE